MTLDDTTAETIPQADPQAVRKWENRYSDRADLPCWTRGDQFEVIVEDEETGMVHRSLPSQWRSPWD